MEEQGGARGSMLRQKEAQPVSKTPRTGEPAQRAEAILHRWWRQHHTDGGWKLAKMAEGTHTDGGGKLTQMEEAQGGFRAEE